MLNKELKIKKVKCEDCKKNYATIDFSNDPLMAITHGWGIIKLCKKCFIKRIETHIKDCQKQLKELKKDKK